MSRFQVVEHPVAFRFHQGLGVLESHHAPAFWMEERKDPVAKVLYVISGKGVLVAEKRSWPLVAPCLLVIPRRCSHRIIDAKGAALSLAGLGFETAFAFTDLVERVCAEIAVLDEPGLSRRAGDFVREVLMEEREGGRKEAQFCAALRLLLLLDEKGGVTEDARQRVKRRLAEAEHEPWRRPDLNVAAAEAGMSRRRFSQLCRELTEESWVEHAQRIRMEYAKHLLQQERLAIAVTAFECGYDNLSVFCRDFKAYWEQTPGEVAGMVCR